MDFDRFFDSDDDSDFSGFESDDLEDVLDASEDEEAVVDEDPQWVRNSRQPCPKRPFSGPEPGFVEDTTPDMTELDFLKLFFPMFLVRLMVDETNRYAAQKQATSPDPVWRPVTVPEMLAWMGLRVYMSLVQLPQVNMYWSTDNVFGNHFPRLVMPRGRFQKIQQYFHLNDKEQQAPRGQPGFDKLFLVRPVLDEVVRRCRDAYNLHQNVSVDEAMVKFRGRLSFRQYLPAKPTKYGVKIWMLADPSNGYVGDFQVYTGKENGHREHGLAHRVVTDLTSRLYGRYHIVNMDNYFSSIPLFEDLCQNATYARGTVRQNRKGLPRNHLCKKDVKDRGQFVTSQKGELCASVWMDRKPIYTLSTAEDPFTITSEVPRRKGNGLVENIPAPRTINEYNDHMNGVDIADQLRTEFPTYRTAKKWWTYLFWFLFDLALTNAFVVMRESRPHQKRTKNGNVKSRSMADFRMAVAKQLIGDFTSNSQNVLATIGFGHFPGKNEKSGRCRHCSKTKRREVKSKCIQCNIHLCIECFKDYHADLAENR